MVCTLSVFNGFHDMVASFFTTFDPQIKVLPVEGKTMSANAPELKKLRQNKDIAVFSECLEDNALISYNDNQVMVTLKGVDDNFERLSHISEILYGEGQYQLHADVIDYAVLGIQLTNRLGVGARFRDGMKVYTPRPGERIDPANPASSFNVDELYSPGVVFSVKQQKYDAHYVLTSLRFAQRMFEREGRISSLELRVKPEASIDAVKQQVVSTLGPKYKVLDRYEQQEDVFRIMKIEKFMSYLFLSFILMVACFNIIGSLSMLIIDKKKDVVTLRNLGASDTQISRIFLFEGRLISFVGAVLGIAVGLLVCFLQQQFGFIKLGDSSGSFVVDAYPVSVHATDILIVFVTVLAVGFLAVWYPVRYLSRKLL